MSDTKCRWTSDSACVRSNDHERALRRGRRILNHHLHVPLQGPKLNHQPREDYGGSVVERHEGARRPSLRKVDDEL